MTTWFVFALAMLSWGCGMAEQSVVFQPGTLEGMKEVAASASTTKLDDEVKTFLRDRHGIVSARYFEASGDVPWNSLAKSIQNQMKEKKIERVMLPWYEPGLDLIELYPQAGGRAFAFASPKGTKNRGDKLIGYYVLGAPPAVKK